MATVAYSRTSKFDRRQAIFEKMGKVAVVVILFMILITVFIPLIFALNTSLKTYQDYMLNPTEINVFKWQFENYIKVLQTQNLIKSTFNSIIVTGTAVLCSVIFTAIVSFACGTLKFKGSKIVYFFAITSMFISSEITMVPLYILFVKLGFFNNMSALIVPSFIGVPGFGILVGASYVRSIPNEVHEAAIIDGTSAPGLFFKVDLPLMKPILALTAVMTFQGNWGAFLWPFVTVLGNKDAHTMPLTLITEFSAVNGTSASTYCAALMLMSLPIVIVFIFFSKYFIEGMTAGSVKG